MREVSQQLREILDDGGYDVSWTADLIYNGEPRAQNLLLDQPRFGWDASAQIQGKGSCRILWDDIFTQSIVPREIGDLFSPFGAELQADVLFTAGDFEERISMGRFVLDSVPAAVEYAIEHPRGGTPVIVGSSVSLALRDYFLRIGRDSFDFPTSPRSSSMWDEAQRLTGLPVFRSVPDRILPTAITYDEDRLDALEKVFGPSNAWPALTPNGALTAMPKAWPDPVSRIERVLEAPLVMRSENVYNRVVVEGKNPDPGGPVLRAVAEITDGFLRTKNPDGSRSPFGGNTFPYRSDMLTTQEQCQDYANELLAQVSRIRSVVRRIVEPFNPLRELGDVHVLADPSRMYEESLVRVRGIEHAGAQTVTEVEVRDG